LLISAIGMGMTTLFGVPAVQSRLIPAWLYGAFLAWAALVGLLSPEIERAWAKSKLWGSDHYWGKR
jgi:hypothetical protein